MRFNDNPEKYVPLYNITDGVHAVAMAVTFVDVAAVISASDRKQRVVVPSVVQAFASPHPVERSII